MSPNHSELPTETMSTSFFSVSPSARMLQLDTLWGVVLAVLCVAATIGNNVSFIYFLKRRKKTIHDTLYTIMCVLDTVTSLLSCPVAVVLFSSRKQVMFMNATFCGIWTVLFKSSTTMILFLVMIISVSRTVSIMAPFHAIMKNLILGSIAVYALIDLGFHSVLYVMDVVQFVFYNDMGYCSISPKSFIKEATRKIIWDKVFVPVANIQTFGPIMIVFVSFILSVYALITRKKAGPTGRQEKKVWRASVTIAIFTAIYTFCQLPLIVTKMMSHCIKWFDTIDLFPLDTFIGWNYSALFQVIFPILNASLNPFLYYFRMPQYKLWIRGGGGKISSSARAMSAALTPVRMKKTPLLIKQQPTEAPILNKFH